MKINKSLLAAIALGLSAGSCGQAGEAEIAPSGLAQEVGPEVLEAEPQMFMCEECDEEVAGDHLLWGHGCPFCGMG